MFLLELLGALFGLLVFLVLAAVFVGGPVLGLLAFWRVRTLSRRVAALEEEVARLQARPGAEAAPVPELVEEIEPAATVEPIAPAPPEPARTRLNLEGLLGGRVLGWAAVVLMLLAAGYFLAYALESGWIGPTGQVAIGVLGGAGLCVAGFALHRRGRPVTAQMLSAAGVAILYLSVFASFGYYRLLPMSRAGPYLTAVVALTAGLAVAYPARGIAVLSLVGGLISPLLLHSDRDPYVSFFLYLALLDAGMLAMSAARGWLLLAPLSLLGVQALFWGWAEGRYHPEKLPAVLAFQAAVLLLHLAHDVIRPALARRAAHLIQLVGVVAAGFAFALAGTTFVYEDAWRLLPTLAVGLAALYALQARFVQSRGPLDGRLEFTLVAVGLGLLATAFALRLEAGWVGVAWAVEGLALWWYALRARSLPVRGLAAVLLLMATGQVVFGTPWPLLGYYGPYRRPWEAELFVPVFNRHALPGVVVAVALLVAAWQARTTVGRQDTAERAGWLALVLGGVVLGWLVLSMDVYRFVRVLEARNDWSPFEAVSLAGMSVTILWAVYAAVVLAAGFWRDSPTLRYCGLGLFAVAMLKALAVDSARLTGGYRVLAFFVLAVLMAVGAWTYQRLERAHRDAPEGTT